MPKAKINTGAVYATTLAPTRKRGRWTIESLPVGGEDAADAVHFADALRDSLRAHSDMEEVRRRTWGPPLLDSIPHCAGHDGGTCYAGVIHTGQCTRLHQMRYPDRDGTSGLVERFRAMRGEPVPAPVRARAAKVARKAAPKVVPAVSVAQVAPPADPTACPRCGRVGWKSDVGRSWHIDNNPDCQRFRRPDRHQYAQA